jgi:hypothetical protein
VRIIVAVDEVQRNSNDLYTCGIVKLSPEYLVIRIVSWELLCEGIFSGRESRQCMENRN